MSAVIIPRDYQDEQQRVTERTHGIPDDWLIGRLPEWFHKETPSPKAWVCCLSETGKWGYWDKTPNASRPDIERRNYARRVVQYLNREFHFGGAWIGAWMDDGWRCFYLLWKDSDGDIQIPMECDRGWREIRKWPVDGWGHQATAAHDLWRAAQAALALKGDQTLKLAQGQTSIERL